MTLEDTRIQTPTLTKEDRCDACGAQAYVRVELPYGELYFCGHHASINLPKLEHDALHIDDERAHIS